jgi:uncharacterized YkwD family protein
MKKKAFLSLAVAAGLLMGNPFGNTASAQESTNTNQHVVKIYQSGNFNFGQGSFQSFFDQYLKELSERFGIQFHYKYQQPQQQPEKAPEQKPVQQQPVEQQPAEKPAQEPVQQPTQPAPAPQPQENEQAQYGINQFEQQVVQLTNAERAKHGLAPLKLDGNLSKVAREKSMDMARKGYFSHTSPTYGSPFDMMKQFGISYRAAGENIAKGQRTPEEVVNAWMNSDGHRKNILSSNYTHIGVGYVAEGNIWTQMFIGK